MFTGNEAKGETKKRAGDREPRREQPLSRRSGENGITGWQEQKKRERGKEGKEGRGKGRDGKHSQEGVALCDSGQNGERGRTASGRPVVSRES